jgi:hypothetical protein
MQEIKNNSIEHLYRIISGDFECSVDGIKYIYRQPTPSVLFNSEKEYVNTINQYRDEILSQENMLLEMVSLNLWSPSLEAEYQAFDKKLENLKISLYEAYVGYRKREGIKVELDRARERYRELSNKRTLYDFCTLETLANDFKIHYIILNSLEPKIDPEDIDLINKIIPLVFVQYVSDDVVRDLSTLSEWRAMWHCAGGDIFNLFGKPSTLLTREQISIVNWSKFYDNIHENSECPPQEVIDDNDLLDGWALLQNRKRNKDGDKSDNVQGSEVFIMVENPDDVGRVESKNTFQSKMIKRQREAVIKNKGMVEEQHMPDSQMRINEQARLEQIRRMHGK